MVVSCFQQSLRNSFFQNWFLMESLLLQRNLGKPFVQKGVLQKQILLGRTSALQEEHFWNPYFLEYTIKGWHYFIFFLLSTNKKHVTSVEHEKNLSLSRWTVLPRVTCRSGFSHCSSHLDWQPPERSWIRDGSISAQFSFQRSTAVVPVSFMSHHLILVECRLIPSLQCLTDHHSPLVFTFWIHTYNKYSTCSLQCS